VGVGAGLYMHDVVVEKFTFAISSPDEFFLLLSCRPHFTKFEHDTSVDITMNPCGTEFQKFSDKGSFKKMQKIRPLTTDVANAGIPMVER